MGRSFVGIFCKYAIVTSAINDRRIHGKIFRVNSGVVSEKKELLSAKSGDISLNIPWKVSGKNSEQIFGRIWGKL